MANAFSKEERVAFEDLLEGFNDALVLSRNVSVYRTDQVMMERARDTIWRPQPYIAQSINSTPGTSIALQYQDMTQLAVPATLGFSQTVPWTMTALQLRDALQEGRLGQSASQKLASDINVAIMNVASSQGTLVVSVPTGAGSYDDVALCDTIMNEQGVVMNDRALALSSRDYNGLAGNIASAQARSFNGNKSNTAFERSFVGMVAGFETYKMDYSNAINVPNPSTTQVTIDTANQYYVPQATSNAVGGQINVDNRFQNILIDIAAGGQVSIGDAFTVANVEALHHITKQSTGQEKTFRVIALPNAAPGVQTIGSGAGQTITISPPFISGQGGSDAELQYQNINSTPAAGATITFLNTTAGRINVFWQRDALEILPGRYAVPSDAGVAVMRATTDNGIEVVMQKFYDIDSMTIKYRLDTLYGVVNKQPEMSGILLFGQT